MCAGYNTDITKLGKDRQHSPHVNVPNKVQQRGCLTVKLSSHSGRLGEHTADKGKPSETILLHMCMDKVVLMP